METVAVTRLCPCGQPAVQKTSYPRCASCRATSSTRGRARTLEKQLNSNDIRLAECATCRTQFTYVYIGQPRKKCDECRATIDQKAQRETEARRSERGSSPWQARRVRMLDYRRLVNYGIDRARYEAILTEQGERCANPGCRSESPGNKYDDVWSIDHDHSCCPGERTCGMCIRGILCSKCNLGIGMFSDDVARLLGAASYLTSHARRAVPSGSTT